MSIKTKSPPKKNAGEVAALFKGSKIIPSSGYLRQLTNLLGFLVATDSIRTSAEVVEEGLNLSKDGSITTYENARSYFISHKLSGKSFLVKEENEAYGKLNAIYRELYELGKIIRSNAKVNTDEKKEKAQKKIDELQTQKAEAQAELNEVRKQINELKEDAKQKLEATQFTIEEIREQEELMAGAKVKIMLETGSYTFPVPVGIGYYREVCNMLGLPLEHQEVEKLAIKRMFTFPAAALEAIRKAMLFVSNDDLRPSMTGVLLEINANNMTVVATDAHRLFKSRTFKVEGPPGNHDYILPASSMKRLPKAIKEDFKFYEIKGNKASFLGIDVEMIDAKYPDYKVVMPTDYEGFVRFDRKDMMEAVKEVAVYSNKSTSQVNFYFNGEIQLSAQDVDFSFESKRRMAYKEKTMHDLTIAFNGKFMAEALTVFKTEDVTIQAATPTKAALISDGLDLVLLMPLMMAS